MRTSKKAKKIVCQKSSKISVTMPAYNSDAYIKEAIESILCQDYANFELLILDDGSIDATFKIINEYKDHPHVKIYRNKKNVGAGAARNKLISLATGKYISPCDADDIMLPRNLRTLSRYLDAHKDIGLVYTDTFVIEIDKNNNLIKPAYIEGRNYDTTWDLIEPYCLVNHVGSMIRKNLILKVGGYDETVYCSDDKSLCFKLSEITKFKYLKHSVYYLRRKHPGSLTTTVTWKRFCSDTLKIKKEAIKRRYGVDVTF